MDETYGPNLVDLLREKDLHAVTYRNVCDINPGDPDVRWIPNVASRQWVAVTADKQSGASKQSGKRYRMRSYG